MLNRILIDSQAFALKKERLHGTVALRDLDERTWSHDIADLSSELAYTLTGSTDRWQRPVLTLALSGRVPLQCQRCMQPIENFELDEHVQIVLFPTEAQLDEAMLADEELEGMLSADELDVFSLIEDQILMALPFSPRHEQFGNRQSKQTQSLRCFGRFEKIGLTLYSTLFFRSLTWLFNKTKNPLHAAVCTVRTMR